MQGYEKRDEYTDKEKVEFHVLHHRHSIRESLEHLHDYTNEVEEFAYSGDIVQTLRSVKRLRNETEHLHSTINHLLEMLEKINER